MRGWTTAIAPWRSPSAETAADWSDGRIVVLTERPRLIFTLATIRLPNHSSAPGRPLSRVSKASSRLAASPPADAVRANRRPSSSSTLARGGWRRRRRSTRSSGRRPGSRRSGVQAMLATSSLRSTGKRIVPLSAPNVRVRTVTGTGTTPSCGSPACPTSIFLAVAARADWR